MAVGPGAKRSAGNCLVFVRGFDFGTTDEQFEGHMSTVGTITNIKWVTKGSAEVTYSSPDEAAAAVEQLQKSTIDGNTRFIDVLAKDEGERPMKSFKSSGKGYGNPMAMLFGKAFGKGWGWGGGGGKGGGGGGKSRRGGDHKDEDPAGSGRVFVRGFDFGTDDEQFEGHMSTAGPIHRVHWVTKGSAVVVYKKKASALKAVNKLNQTTIAGNTRYIDIILKDE